LIFLAECFYTVILDRKDQKNNIFSRYFCDFGWYHNESGKMPPCYVRFAPMLRRTMRRKTLPHGAETLHRWMIGFMRRREILGFTLPAQGKEAAARSPLSLGFLC
jgi:hypothetical protein